jgi:HPt (histidine-containing phosphotransfer) domain-containing protein
MPNMDDLLTEEMMAPLRAFYLKELEGKYAKLQLLLKERLKGQALPAQKEELTLLAHNLSGSGASYGFPELSERDEI